MKQLDINTLVAYVDGELDLEASSQVERALAEDAEAQEVVNLLRETAVLVHAAHKHVIHETVPDRLVDLIEDSPETDQFAGDSVPERLVSMILEAPESQSENSRPQSRHATVIPMARRRSVAAAAMAAAVGAVMLGSFYAGQSGILTGNGGQDGVHQVRAVAAMTDPFREAAFQDALENKKSQQAVVWENPESGTGGAIIPVKTYRRSDGTFCRAFRTVDSADRPTRPNVGVACRDPGPDGRWVKTVEAIAAPGEKPDLRY